MMATSLAFPLAFGKAAETPPSIASTPKSFSPSAEPVHFALVRVLLLLPDGAEGCRIRSDSAPDGRLYSHRCPHPPDMSIRISHRLFRTPRKCA